MTDERGHGKPRRNPVFSRIVNVEQQVARSAVEGIVERRVSEARDEGLFDNLQGQGKPIADLDTSRPPGWWAQRFVAEERKKLKQTRLGDEVRSSWYRTTTE